MLGRRLGGPHGFRISASFLQSVCWVSTKQQITSLSSVALKWKPLLLGTEFFYHRQQFLYCICRQQSRIKLKKNIYKKQVFLCGQVIWQSVASSSFDEELCHGLGVFFTQPWLFSWLIANKAAMQQVLLQIPSVSLANHHPTVATYLPTTALEMCNSFAQAPHYHIPRLLT